jgi:hypothetical protein
MKLISLFVLALALWTIEGDTVCTEEELITELRQDVDDNKQLDCLRKPRELDEDEEEHAHMKKLRISAAWDSDCAFESSGDWLKLLKENYALEGGFLDVNGKP